MAASPRNEGGTQLLSARVRKTIKSIKEIVGNHSDAEIYVALKEANMDPNETTQKLLIQDPFHEVKRKRDRKKENTGFKNLAEPKKQFDHASPGTKVNKYPDRNNRRGGYARDSSTFVNQQFRVVRDNRTNPNPNEEPPSLPPISTKEHAILHTSDKSSTGILDNQKPSGDVPAVSVDRQPQGTTSNDIAGKEVPKERWVPVKANASHVQVEKLDDSKQRSAVQVPNQSLVGMYSSSSDPVHVPSPESRATSNVGAIKREVGVVGVRSLPLKNPAKIPSSQVVSNSNPHARKDGQSSRESQKSVTAASKIEPSSRTSATESVAPVSSMNKTVTNNQYNSRPTQQITGHQKASQTGKEWKPKSSKKLSTRGPGVIGTPSKSVPTATDNSKDVEKEAEPLQDKDQPSRINETNVIIAEHIRINGSDRSGIIFGSFGKDTSSAREFLSGSHVGNEEKPIVEHSPRISSPPELPSIEETSVSNHVDLLHEPAKQSEPISQQIPERKDISNPPNLNNYVDTRLYAENNQSYAPQESQNQQYPSELSSFSAYEPQTGYDIPYFRPAMDEAVRGMDISSSQEALASHSVSPIPSTSLSMVQQPPQLAQMYPQVHVPHFPNLMPYRQFLSPVYVPPMPMPAGYSTTPTYGHPSSGNSYLMMPGANSHRVGMQQFKPVPAGSPTGFGNFTSPNGYAINPPTAVLDDSSRMKYKDGNLYIPNQQAEASEIWIQNQRDLQAATYYNMQGQSAHGAYLSSHAGHGSFNPAGVAQSSHMQFPAGLYHPAAPQQPGMAANSHHLGPNVVAGAAPPGPQVGAYQQQPQLGHHLNWTTNF